MRFVRFGQGMARSKRTGNEMFFRRMWTHECTETKCTETRGNGQISFWEHPWNMRDEGLVVGSGREDEMFLEKILERLDRAGEKLGGELMGRLWRGELEVSGMGLKTCWERWSYWWRGGGWDVLGRCVRS